MRSVYEPCLGGVDGPLGDGSRRVAGVVLGLWDPGLGEGWSEVFAGKAGGVEWGAALGWQNT
jgi:hypothetical protein